MSKIIVHQLEISPFCDKIRRILYFKDLPFEAVNVPMAKLSKLKRMSPAGKVPVMEIDGEVIADSSDISRALEQHYPNPPLFPEDPVQRAQVNILEDWADESLYFFEMTMRFTWPDDRQKWVTQILKYDSPLMAKLLRPIVPMLTRKAGMTQGLARRDESAILAELQRHVDAIAALLKGSNYLVGNQLTLADISVLAQLECVAGSGKGLAVMQTQAALMQWMERVESRTGGPAIR